MGRKLRGNRTAPSVRATGAYRRHLEFQGLSERGLAPDTGIGQLSATLPRMAPILARRHVAGLLAAAGQLLLMRLSSANSINFTAAMSLHAGRLSVWRTLGTAVLPVLIVGMGASFGREGTPK